MDWLSGKPFSILLLKRYDLYTSVSINSEHLKQIILLTLLTLVFKPIFSQDQIDFEYFKTGKFTYEGKEGEVEIIRTKNKQIEVYNGGNSKLILKIKWINDSTYVLTHKKSINAPGCLEKGDWIKATILNGSKDQYECSYTSNRCGEGKSIFIKLE